MGYIWWSLCGHSFEMLDMFTIEDYHRFVIVFMFQTCRKGILMFEEV